VCVALFNPNWSAHHLLTSAMQTQRNALQPLLVFPLRTSAPSRPCVENTVYKQPLNAMPLEYNGDVHPVCEQP